ncbi:MAG: WG repeat-containing protein [Candidatus Cryptobacteroides sp.]
MAKQSVIAGEYIIQIEDNGHVDVVRVPRNAYVTMEGIAKEKGFPYDPKWNTHQFGRALCKEYGDGWTATFGDITITRQKDNSIEIIQKCKPARRALQDICEKMGFEYDRTWNTQHLGRKVVKYLLENKNDADKILRTPNAKRCAEPASPAAAINTDGWKRFSENDKYGFKDENDKVVIPCKYDYVGWSWENGFCKVQNGREEGYIDSAGKEIIPVEFDSVSYMKEGNYFIVQKGGWSNRKTGVMSPEGKVVLPVEYDDCDQRWLKGKCVLRKDGASYILGNGGVIERTLPYDHYEEFDDATGLSLVRRDGKWGYVNKDLEEVVACENQFYVLCVECNPYLMETMSTDDETLKNSYDEARAGNEDEFEENGLGEEEALSQDNVGTVISMSGRYMFQQYGSECNSYIDEVEKIYLAPVAGDNWWDEWFSMDHDDDLYFSPEEAEIEQSDYPINENCIEVVYKRSRHALGMFYRLLIKDIDEFDPSKLKMANPTEDSYDWSLPEAFYDDKPLKYLGNGFDDSEFEYSTARLFWDGEEIDLPETDSNNDEDEDW